jgi:hypothetical protein
MASDDVVTLARLLFEAMRSEDPDAAVPVLDRSVTPEFGRHVAHRGPTNGEHLRGVLLAQLEFIGADTIASCQPRP